MPTFSLGRLVATPAAVATCVTLLALVYRHRHCDWGDLGAEDKASNDSALIHGGRVLSKYIVDEHSFYVITEDSREVTTVLLCSDY